MTLLEWVNLIFVAIQSVVMPLIIWLMTKNNQTRIEQFARIYKRLDEVETNQDAHALQDVRDHSAIHAQVVDSLATISANYVRQQAFDATVRDVNNNLIEIRKEIGAANVRIDQLLARH